MSEEIMQQIKERMRIDRAFRHDLLASPWRVLQAYPLTEEEKQLFVVPNFSWMIENRLAGVSYPRSEDAIALLRKQGVQALLNLSEEPLPLDLLSKYQLRGEHLPVADFTAPTLDQGSLDLIIIDGFLAQGRLLPSIAVRVLAAPEPSWHATWSRKALLPKRLPSRYARNAPARSKRLHRRQWLRRVGSFARRSRAPSVSQRGTSDLSRDVLASSTSAESQSVS